jgi:hypothetical protein
MNFRDQTLFIAMAVMAMTMSPGHAQSSARACSNGSSCPASAAVAADTSSDAPVCGDACSAPQMRTTSTAVSRSLEASPADALALSSAAQTGDMTQVHTLLLKHGFTEAQLTYQKIEVKSVVSPRDAASGLPTGKRMHKPFVITKELDKSSPTTATSQGGVVVATGDVDGDGAAAKIKKVVITVSLKPPSISIVIHL